MLYLFLIIDLYFLIPVVTARISNPIAYIAMPKGIPTKEAKTKIETHSVTTEVKINKCSIQLKSLQTFFASYSSNYSKIISCFIYIFQSKFLTYICLLQPYVSLK